MPSFERAYAMFLRCHRIAADATSEAGLAHDICAAAVDELGYVLAWVGVIEAGGRVRPIGHAGFEDGYLEALDITTAGEHGDGPTGTAIRQARPSVCRDIAHDPRFEPWRDDALARGYGSSAAIPLVRSAQVLGALNLYAREPGAFDERELALLEEVAVDVTLGLVAIRSASSDRALAAPLAELARMELACSVTASVAHDLQNMLGVAMLSLSELGRHTPLGARDPALVDATSAVRSASELTRQMLLLSKRTSSSQGTVDVDAYLSGMEPLLRRIAGEGSRVTLDLDAGCGRVPLAPIDLQRVAINLVLNAAEAGSHHVNVRIETRTTEGGTLSLRVIDDGPGIRAELLPRVFDVDATTKSAPGGGLGLASVAQLVNAAGGQVTVRSEPGRGTTFTITLPRVLPLARATSAR